MACDVLLGFSKRPYFPINASCKRAALPSAFIQIDCGGLPVNVSLDVGTLEAIAQPYILRPTLSDESAYGTFSE